MKDKQTRRKNRITNSKRNISVSTLVMSLSAILMYVERVVFVAIMPISYVGLSGLFVNIFNYLAIADLGINVALMYCLYEPIARDDYEQIRSIMRLVKRVFFVLGWIIFFGGLICAFCIEFFVRPEDMVENIRLFLVMFIFSQAVTYWCGYKSILIDAHQNQYITVSAVHIGNCIQLTLQIIFITLFKNYFIYLLILDVVNFAKYFYLARLSDRLYPYTSRKNKNEIIPLPNNIYTKIKMNVVPLFLHKIGYTIINSTDTILLSMLFGTVLLGKYNNYILLSNSFMTVFWLLSKSVTSSIGDMCIDEDKNDIMHSYNQMLFGNFSLSSVSGVLFVAIAQPFIDLSFGTQFELSFSIIFALGFNLFLSSMRIVNSTFRDAMGLFAPDWYKPILETITNIIISYFLGKKLGPIGVVLGTTLTYICITFWIETYVVIKVGLGKRVFRSYSKLLLYILVYMIMSYVVLKITELIHLSSFIASMILFAMIGIFISSLVLLCFLLGSKSARCMFDSLLSGFKMRKRYESN